MPADYFPEHIIVRVHSSVIGTQTARRRTQEQTHRQYIIICSIIQTGGMHDTRLMRTTLMYNDYNTRTRGFATICPPQRVRLLSRADGRG